MKKNEEPLVFVHGIKGGLLSDASGLRWVGLSHVLCMDLRPLSLPLTWTDAGQDRDGITAVGPIENVAHVNFYRPPLRWLRQRYSNVRTFSWDWRRELGEAAESLVATLEEVAREHGRPARVVAHSMGGLVTWLALRQRPDLCGSVLFAGVPFGMGVAFMRDVHLGFKPGWLNKWICTPQAVASWSAHWVFFPTDGRGLMDGDKHLDHDWYDVAAHEEHRIGVFAEGMVDDLEPYRKHLAQSLARAKNTRALLADVGPLADANLKIAVLTSGAHPTPATVQRGGPAAVRGWDVDNVEYVPGDVRVLSGHTEPPGVPCRIFETPADHMGLLNNVDTLETVFAWLDETS